LQAPPKQCAPSIAEAATFQLAVTCIYTFLVIAATGHPKSLTAQLVNFGVVATDQVLGLLFGSPVEPEVDALMPEGVAVYQHVLLVCIIVIAITFSMTRQYRRNWADSLRHRFRIPLGKCGSMERLMVGYRLAVLGLTATALLAFLGEWRLSEAGWDLYTPSWTFLRAPILTSIGFWFACHVEALRFGLLRQSRDQAHTDDGT
jgi:hypothetical protein